MRRRRLAAALAAGALCLGSAGCCFLASGHPANRSEVVGRYLFRMEDSGAAYHSPDRLVLEANGTYVLTRMPGGRPGAVQRGTWRYYAKPPWGGKAEVDLGRNSYPVETCGGRLRFDVEPDLGYYWYKVAK